MYTISTHICVEGYTHRFSKWYLDPIRLVCLLLSQTPQQLIVTLTIR